MPHSKSLRKPESNTTFAPGRRRLPGWVGGIHYRSNIDPGKSHEIRVAAHTFTFAQGRQRAVAFAIGASRQSGPPAANCLGAVLRPWRGFNRCARR